MIVKDEEYFNLKYSFFEIIKYEPTPIQNKVHRSSKRYVVWAGGARSGKSMAAGYEAAFAFLTNPDFRIWVVGTQYELAEKEFLWAIDALGKYRVDDQMQPDETGRPVLDYCRLRVGTKGSKEVISPWGAFIKTKSTEKAQTLLGEELDLLILAEASQLPRTVWSRQLRPRISPRKGGAYAFSTPNDDGGLFSEFKDNVLKKGIAEWDFFQSSVLENTHFPKEEFELMRSTMSKKDFQEQCEGKFVSRRGLIFEPQVYQPFILDSPPSFISQYANFEDMPVLVGIHRGFKNPAFVVYARYLGDTEGKKYLFVFKTKQYQEHRTDEIIKDIQEETKGKPFRGVIVDLYDSLMLSEMSNSPLSYTTNDEEKKIGRLPAITKRLQGVKEAFEDKRLYVIGKECGDLITSLESSKWNEISEVNKEKGKLESEIPNSVFMQGIYALSHICAFIWSASYRWYQDSKN